MANIKFSQFTQKTTLGTVDFLVGYTGAQNIQIDPADLLSDYSQGTGAAGQVTFFSATSTVTGDNDFYWDNTNKRLGVGTTTPSTSLHVNPSNGGNGEINVERTSGTIINLQAQSALGVIGTNSNHDLAFKTNGAAHVRIKTNGNVGIGTASPSAKLHVDGTLIATGVSQLGSGGSNVYLTSSSAGSVGIGTSSPAKKLHVRGSAPWIRIEEDSASNKRLDLYVNPSTAIGVIAANQSAQQLSFQTSNTDRLRITNAGNVGIGTTSPQYKLDVDGDVQINETLIAKAGADLILQARSSQVVGINSNGTRTMTLDASNNVGIGTSSPDKKLHIVDTNAGAVTYPLRLQNSGTTVGTDVGLIFTTKTSGGGSASSVIRSESEDTSGNNSLVFTTPSGGSTAERMRIGSDGKVYFGNQNNAASSGYIDKQTSGDYEFKIHASTSTTVDRAITFHNRSNTEAMRIDSSGNVGIGTTSPGAKLEVKGATAENTQIRIQTDGGASEVPTLSLRRSSIAYGEIKYIPDGGGNQGVHITDYRTDVSNIIFNTAGANERMRIDSAGNVGIGTTSPVSIGGHSGILTLYGSNATALALKDAVSEGHLRFDDSNFKFTNSGGTVRMQIEADTGDVGIGTTDPLGKLHVSTGNDSNSGNIEFIIGGTNGSNARTGRIIKNTSSPYEMTIRASDFSNGNDLILNDNGGRVGIGTTSPTAKLQIESTSGNALSFTHSGQETYNISHGTSGLYLKLGSTLLTGWTQNHDFTIWDTSGNNYVMFDGSTQNVGIGTTSPQAKLEITTLRESGIRLSSSDISAAADELLSGIDFYSPDTGNEGIKASIKVNYADTAANSYMTFSTGANTERMRIDSSGNILFGTTGTPNGTSVYGSAFLSTSNERMALVQASNTTSLATMQTYYNPNGAVGTIKTTGSATQFNTSSDYRLKKDLKDFNGLDKVSKIPVYDFKWKVDDSRSYGVMAHELQEVLPDAVSGEKDGEEMQGVDYSKIVPLLIKSIQELEAKVKELESK